ncbi:hypothetical protein [Haliscomenobacter hydrossis]|uniref:Uncharacterized protein n=1 Tax=Haliscomenobacter hydrossis (strain ATCC 27775 / DSM 1100 / LMG 10767 / O) TaxID=760192 RepID=F4L023_HALH1|nr:hypothetical protein [Haliscomenobacter hydrossis]AEE52732.1 hypothetical protein Halhy_4903 [Haliscomenobacter hydrossis DSM 1100]
MHELSFKFTGLTATEDAKARQINVLLTAFATWWSLLKPSEWTDFVDFVGFSSGKEPAFNLELLRRIKQALQKKTEQLRGDELLAMVAKTSTDEKLGQLKESLKDLFQILKDYLVYAESSKNPQVYHRLLVKSVRERNRGDLFQSVGDEFARYLKKVPSTIAVAADQWWLDHQRYYNQYTDHTPELFLQNLQSLETFNQLLVARNYLELLNQGLTKAVEDTFALQQKMELVIKYGEPVNETVLLYRHLIETIQGGDQINLYHTFVDVYHRHETQISKEDRLILAKMAINYLYIRYHKTGERAMLEAIFGWMKIMSDQDLYNFEGTIHDAEYINFFMVARSTGELAAYHKFREKHLSFLEPGVREQVDALCTAFLHFDAQEYTQALSILLETFPPGSQEKLKYNLRAKVLRIMVQYAFKNQGISTADDDLIRSIDNFGQYCRRLLEKKIMNKKTIEPHQQFQKIALLLAKFEGSPEEEKPIQLARMKEKLSSTTPIAYRSWLEEEINKLG